MFSEETIKYAIRFYEIYDTVPSAKMIWLGNKRKCCCNQKTEENDLSKKIFSTYGNI